MQAVPTLPAVMIAGSKTEKRGMAHHGGAKGWYAASTLLIGQLASMLREIRTSARNDTAMKES
jgi:hypothetical protein